MKWSGGPPSITPPSIKWFGIPSLYNLPAYLAASDVALAKSDANRSTLIRYLSDPDSGIRYWGVSGLMMLKSLDPGSRQGASWLPER